MSRIFAGMSCFGLMESRRCRPLYSSWIPLVQFVLDFFEWVSQESDGDAKGFKEGEATPANTTHDARVLCRKVEQR